MSTVAPSQFRQVHGLEVDACLIGGQPYPRLPKQLRRVRRRKPNYAVLRAEQPFGQGCLEDGPNLLSVVQLYLAHALNPLGLEGGRSQRPTRPTLTTVVTIRLWRCVVLHLLLKLRFDFASQNDLLVGPPMKFHGGRTFRTGDGRRTFGQR